MKLTVIGCSPAWPNAGGAHSGYLVEAAGRRLLLDCGPGVLGRLRRDGLLPIDAIAITHLHLDHWGDLVPWVWFLEHGRGSGGRPALWLPPEAQTALDAFGDRFGRTAMFEKAFELGEYEPRTPFVAAGLEVTALPMVHYAFPAYGFRVVDGDGALLAYSGDTGPCPALGELAAGADLFLCEATLAAGADDAEERGHLSADEALAVGNGRIVLTHRPAELEAPTRGVLAHEGLTVDV